MALCKTLNLMLIPFLANGFLHSEGKDRNAQTIWPSGGFVHWKEYCASNLYMTCTTCALVQYIEENDRNAATIWSMGVCCQFKAGLASPQPFLFTHSPLTVNGDHIKEEEEKETTLYSVYSNPPTMMMMMMMIIRMTPQQTKTVDPGGIQRPRTRCGTQTSSFAPGPSPLPSHLLNQPLHVSLFLFLQLDYNI